MSLKKINELIFRKLKCLLFSNTLKFYLAQKIFFRIFCDQKPWFNATIDRLVDQKILNGNQNSIVLYLRKFQFLIYNYLDVRAKEPNITQYRYIFFKSSDTSDLLSA